MHDAQYVIIYIKKTYSCIIFQPHSIFSCYSFRYNFVEVSFSPIQIYIYIVTTESKFSFRPYMQSIFFFLSCHVLCACMELKILLFFFNLKFSFCGPYIWWWCMWLGNFVLFCFFFFCSLICLLWQPSLVHLRVMCVT